MNTLFDFHFAWLGIPMFAVVLLAMLVVIVLAIFRRDNVRTGIRWRSFGFFLEANDGAMAKAERKGTLPK